MKAISLSEAKANLRRYGQLCHDEPIVVTVNGVPSFQLAPEDDENLIDRLIERDPKFRELLQKRLGEPTVTIRAALRRL